MKWSPNGIIWFFDFSSFFFGIFYYPSGRNGTESQFLFFIFLGISQPLLAWNEAIPVFFNLFNFFAIFLEFYLKCQVVTKRNNNFYFLTPSFFQPILAWNHAIKVFFNFLNFFVIFLEFSITHCVGTERNDNFYFPSFSTFSILFWLEVKPQWYFFYFFFLYFWNFILPVG